MFIDIENPVLKKYDEKEIQALFIQFVEEKEKNEPVLLHQIDYEDLNKEEKKAYDKYKNYSVEDFKKAWFINF